MSDEEILVVKEQGRESETGGEKKTSSILNEGWW
jgi:hypothetical protein